VANLVFGAALIADWRSGFVVVFASAKAIIKVRKGALQPSSQSAINRSLFSVSSIPMLRS
jgi:hypothetical protein